MFVPSRGQVEEFLIDGIRLAYSQYQKEKLLNLLVLGFCSQALGQISAICGFLL